MRADLSLGSVLGDFRLERVAGRGGMGVVYEATELTMSRRVALKVIASDLADDESFRARFARELSYVVALEHPNVIPVYRAGEVDGVLFIAMRYVAGIDLRVLLARCRRLAPASATRILAQVAAALDRAHAAGLVHRDVKPGNILLDGEDASAHVYLTDFGLTKHVTSAGGLTRPGALVGTPGYIAPEQVLGEPVDARTDVYSLTCVLFEMLTGQPPYVRDSEAAMLFAHVQEDPPAIHEVAPELNEGFAEVIARGMATAREDRYQSAGDLARAASLAADDRAIVVAEESVATGAAAPKAIDTRLSAARWRSRAKDSRIRSAPGASPADAGASPSRSGAATGDGLPAETPAAPAGASAGPAAGQPPGSPVSVPGAEPGTAPPPARPAAAGPGAGRRRRLSGLVVAGLVVLVGAVVAVALMSGGGDDAGPVRSEQTPGRAAVAVGTRPSDVVTSDRFAWVANTGDGTISRLDVTTGAARGAPIRVGGSPTALALDGGALFVLDGQAGRLTRIDAGAGRVVGRPSAHPGDALTAGFGSLWVVNGTGGDVQRVDPDSGAAIGRPIDVGSFPVRAAAGEGAVWVVNSDSGTLTRIDPAGNDVVGRGIPIGRGATDVAVGAGAVWVANPASGRVLRVDPDARSADPVATDVPGARWIAAGDRAVWVSRDDDVVRIDPEDNRLVGEPEPVPGAGPVAISGDAVWVVRPEDGELVRIGY